MKIAIIGAGIYGSYISDMLSENKKISVDIFEKNTKILNSIAKKNQYRLHKGYHYPRSLETISQTINGYKIFKKKFKKFLYFPKKNYYLIHNESHINFENYTKIYSSFNLKYKKVSNKNYSKYIFSDQIEGCVNTEEGVILIDKLIPYLKKKLLKKVKIYKGIEIDRIDNKRGIIYSNNTNLGHYDYIINTTYENPNLGLIKKKFQIKYELTGMVKIKKPFKEQLGLTIMDGKYCSIYPQNRDESTISSVKYTPIFKSNSFIKIKDKIKKLNKTKVKNNIINHASKYIKFKNKNLKSKLILSHKVKLEKDYNDERTSSIIFENKLISILCGKIDAVPVIYEQIKKVINKKL